MVIAGVLGAGTLGASLKAYREQKRKKEFPWTMAAERMAKNKLGLVKGCQRSPFYRQTSGEVQVQKEAKRLVVSSASLLFVSAGALFYAPLYVPGILGIVYLYTSFLKGAYTIVKERRVNVQLLYTVVITGAMVGCFFFVMALASWYASIVRWLLAKTENHSRKSLVNLFGEPPRFAWMVLDGAEIEVPFENVQIGEQVVITAGQMIPFDGTISAGQASIDQHKLTGEAQPFEASIGQPVFASTVILSGKITVWVEKIGPETVAAQIGHILNNTADFNLSIKSRVESFLAKVLPVMFGLSAASLPWLGLEGALAVLWCSPGSRIFVLGPMSMLNYLHILSRKGLLIKDGRSLELLNDIDTIVFDKTGTLTEEMPQVRQILICPNGKFSPDQLLTFAAAAEYRQTHPIAKAILQTADMRQLHLPKIDQTHYEIGYGVKVNLNESVIRVGSERFIQMCGITIPAEIKKQQARCHREGYSLVYVAIDEQLGGAIELVPTIRPSAHEVIRYLRESGKKLVIISGDDEAPTRRLAQEVGIDHYFANTLPENKAIIVRQLQEEGRLVCFIGDGINDAIALKQAHVSISLRGATTIAMDTAQIVLMDGSLSQLPSIFELAQEFNHNLNTSFMMTLLPKAIGIAGILFFHWGLLTTLLFNISCWLPQLSHVMLPLIKHRETNEQ
jgi:Cu2+-exporting ATPase